jgi:hypothetical protein
MIATIGMIAMGAMTGTIGTAMGDRYYDRDDWRYDRDRDRWERRSDLNRDFDR